MMRPLVCALVSLALWLALGAGPGRSDPSFNPAVSLQIFGGIDMTRPAGRDNPFPVLAVPAAAAPGFLAVAVGTVSKEVLPAAPAATAWRWRFLQNTDGAVGLWCAFGVPATRAAPSVFLAPRGSLVFDAASFVPAGAVNCIADGTLASVSVTAAQVAR